MRNVAFFISSLFVFAIFNFGIWQKETIKANGETVFLELAPVDPRSLMQGDYMRLRYAVERTSHNKRSETRGYLVISLDQNRVGRFVRFHDKERLAPGEKLLRFHSSYGQIRIVPDSFMFQEGHAQYYQRARYGMFKFDASGNHLLVGLANDQFQPIEPEAGLNS